MLDSATQVQWKVRTAVLNPGSISADVVVNAGEENLALVSPIHKKNSPKMYACIFVVCKPFIVIPYWCMFCPQRMTSDVEIKKQQNIGCFKSRTLYEPLPICLFFFLVSFDMYSFSTAWFLMLMVWFWLLWDTFWFTLTGPFVPQRLLVFKSKPI